MLHYYKTRQTKSQQVLVHIHTSGREKLHENKLRNGSYAVDGMKQQQDMKE